MIRAGFASDKQHAISLFKTTPCGTCTASLTLAGFGTQPIPDAICDDTIQHTVDFAAYYLQKALALLLDTTCTDMNHAKSIIGKQLSKLNDSVSFISRKTGQGVYLAGTVCYVIQEQYTCVTFGNAYACHWYMQKETPLVPWEPGQPEPYYIEDAIGGKVAWEPKFYDGMLPVGSQLLCMTQPPPEELLSGLMSKLIHTNQVVLPVSIYKGLIRNGIPLAVQSIAQAADYGKPEEEDEKDG